MATIRTVATMKVVNRATRMNTIMISTTTRAMPHNKVAAAAVAETRRTTRKRSATSP